jgi:hypothetical protein
MDYYDYSFALFIHERVKKHNYVIELSDRQHRGYKFALSDKTKPFEKKECQVQEYEAIKHFKNIDELEQFIHGIEYAKGIEI